MAKNTTQKSPTSDGSQPLTKEEIKKFQDMVARVGARKTSGFLYIIEETGELTLEKDCSLASGLVFSNGLSKETAIINLIMTFFKKDKMGLILFGFNLIKFVREQV